MNYKLFFSGLSTVLTGLLLMSLLTSCGSGFMTTAASMRVEVEVYKGPLSKSRENQWGEFEGLINEIAESLTQLNDGLINIARDLKFIKAEGPISPRTEYDITVKPSYDESPLNNDYSRVLSEIGGISIEDENIKWCENDQTSTSGCLLMAQMYDDTVKLIKQTRQLKDRMETGHNTLAMQKILEDSVDLLQSLENVDHLHGNMNRIYNHIEKLQIATGSKNSWDFQTVSDEFVKADDASKKLATISWMTKTLIKFKCDLKETRDIARKFNDEQKLPADAMNEVRRMKSKIRASLVSIQKLKSERKIKTIRALGVHLHKLKIIENSIENHNGTIDGMLIQRIKNYQKELEEASPLLEN